MKYKNNEFFGLAMLLARDKEPNYVDFWKSDSLRLTIHFEFYTIKASTRKKTKA